MPQTINIIPRGKYKTSSGTTLRGGVAIDSKRYSGALLHGRLWTLSGTSAAVTVKVVTGVAPVSSWDDSTGYASGLGNTLITTGALSTAGQNFMKEATGRVGDLVNWEFTMGNADNEIDIEVYLKLFEP